MQENSGEFPEADSDDSSRPSLDLASSLSVVSSASPDSVTSHLDVTSGSSMISVSGWSDAVSVEQSLSINDLFRENSDFEDMSDSNDVTSLLSVESIYTSASTVPSSRGSDFEDVDVSGVSSPSSGPSSPSSRRSSVSIDQPDVIDLVSDTVQVIENDPAQEIFNVVEVVTQAEGDDFAEIAVPSDTPSVSGTQPELKALNKSQKRPADNDSIDDEDGQTCTICMDPWSNSGDHRLSSLRCGHLYGYKCIVHWLGISKARGVRRCPQCNKSAKLSDVRVLYAKRLISLDTSDQDAVKQKLEAAEREKNKLEIELKKVELKNQLQEKQLAELRSKLTKSSQVVDNGANCVVSASQSKGAGIGEVKLILHHTQEINKDGGCRILAYKESLNLVVISQSTSSLFSGFGITKMNSLNFRSSQFIYLHSKAIRDLAFHTTDNDLLLSVSLDRTAKLLDISSNNTVQTFQTDSPLWSCSWNVDDSNIFFVGSLNGTVLEYDMRQGRTPISRITDYTKAALSLASVPSTPGGALPRGGFLSCHLDACWAYERINSEYVGKQLPLDGPFFAMRYDRLTDQILVSSRPSPRSLRARHVVCELDRLPSTNSLTCNEIQTFTGGVTQNLLTRPCQMRIANIGSVVVAHNESSNTLAMWNMANSARLCNQPSKEPILDMCPIKVNSNQFLGTISEKTFRVYRVVT